MVKRLIPFIFAGVLGLVAVVMLRQYLGQERARLVQREQELQAEFADRADVLVAAKEIPTDTVITEDYLNVQAVPSKFVQPYAARRGANVLGMVALAPIAEGEQMLTNKLRSQQDRPLAATLSGLTPEGKRAVTIGTDALTGVGGYVRPGDTVDVLWTLRLPQPGGQEAGEPVTMTLFQHVSVLAVGDQMMGKTTTDREANPDYTVTLALDPQEALLLLYAREQGGIQLSLRPSSDEAVAPMTPATMATLMETVLGKDAMLGEPAQKTQRTVEVYKGLERSVVAVNNE